THYHWPGRDGRGGVRRGRGELVVGRVRAAQAQAGGGDGFACAGRFVGEARGAPAQTDVVSAEHSAQGAGHYRRRSRVVVRFVTGSDAAAHRDFGHVKGTADRAGQAAGDAGG